MILYIYRLKSFYKYMEINLYIMSKNTIIDGIAASEHLDSSGESLSIEGMDISSLGGPDSILNWEHGSKEKPSQVVGKVTFARKIMKEKDARNKREAYFWNKIKKPFVYIKAELFDGLGHSGAQDVAAMLKYKNKDKGEDSRLVVGFSIEGGKIEKKGMQVIKSIARDVAITVKPCNKVCDAELIEGDFDDDFLYKNQSWDCEILSKGEILTKSTSYRNLIVENIKKFESKHKVDEVVEDEQIKRKQLEQEGGVKGNKEKDTTEEQIKKLASKKIKQEKNNMRKALIAGMMGGTPDSKTGGAVLASEEIESTLEKPFRSKAQRRFAHANPEKFGGKKGIEEWEEKTPKNIPEKIKKNESDIGDNVENDVFLEHYSSQSGLADIDPAFMGSGVDKRTRGRSLERNKLSHFYPQNYADPESVVTSGSKSKYTVKVPKDFRIFDIRNHGNELFEKAKNKYGRFDLDNFIDILRENGFHGFKSRPHGIEMVGMFEKLPVHSEETSSPFKKNEKLEKNENNHFFHQPYVLFSVEQPYHPTKYKINHEAFVNKLKQKGFDVEHVDGKYGGKQNSIAVKNPTPEQTNYVNKISQKLGQDSVIHSDGLNHKMLYLNGEKAGKYHAGQGTIVHEKEPEDFYSTTGSGTHFTHNFDFDNLHSDKTFKKHEKFKKIKKVIF